MPHDIFISYSSKDQAVADMLCKQLESAGLRCWIAHRNIPLGLRWPAAIANAISDTCIFLVVFSANSNSSRYVERELELADHHNLPIIPFKIDTTIPEPGKLFCLAGMQWLEAQNPPTQAQIDRLVEQVKEILAIAPGIGRVPITKPPVPVPVERPPVMKPRFPWKIIGGAGILTILAILGWIVSKTPVFALAPTQTNTPTSTSTSTLIPTFIPTLTPTSPPANSGKVVIAAISYDGSGSTEPDEYVEIRNEDSLPIQLQNWTLRDTAGHAYKFPDFVMQPAQICRVYTNQLHPEWCGFTFTSRVAIWANEGDCASLRNIQSAAMDDYCY